MSKRQPPSTQWAEIVGESEDQRHQEFAQSLVGIQRRIDKKHGAGRAFHRKQVAGVRGELEVLVNVPVHARFGIFAKPRTFDVLVRMSNGGLVTQTDAIPDIRGLAFSVRGIKGAGAMGKPVDRQDFALINRPEFGFQDSTEFMMVVPAVARGQVALTKSLVSRYGPLGGIREAARLTKDLLRPFTGFATEPFYSAAPIAIGPYAAKLRIRPVDQHRLVSAPLNFTNDLALRLNEGPISYNVQLQFYVNDEDTPIENGAKKWSTAASPFESVARLTIPQQDMESTEGLELARQIEQDRFDAWSALAAHRPLGEIMRARRAAYYPSQQERGSVSSPMPRPTGVSAAN